MIAAMLRKTRLFTGLFLFSFLVTHLANHTVGLFGLAALERSQDIFLLVWRNPIMEGLLALVLLTHLGLGLQALYLRRDLGRLRPFEIVQLILGATILPLITIHVIGTTYANQAYGLNDSYAYVLLTYFLFDPWQGLRQIAALLIAWSHGSIGLWYWLRLKPGFAAYRDWLLTALIVFPLVSLGGVFAAGREALALAERRSWLRAEIESFNLPNNEIVDGLYALELWLLLGYAGLVLLVLAARALRLARAQAKRAAKVEVTYPGGKAVSVPSGSSILEASQSANIPHASVCGGRGRCSTCRVRVIAGRDALPPASPEELRVLRRVKAPENVRLACQTRPLGPVEVEPLLHAGVGTAEAARDSPPRPGEERQLVILFADLRKFTTLAEDMLPYDVVFLLNRYFRGMAIAIEAAGGRVDKYLGDGIMALFGLDNEPEEACRQALAAARAMSKELADMNRALSGNLTQPLRLGIGLHVGPAIVGEMGYGQARALTAIGDTVNTASRLEQMTKEAGVELVLSEEVARLAKVPMPEGRRDTVRVRGRAEPLPVIEVPLAREMSLSGLAQVPA